MTDKINKLLHYKLETIDLNDKLMHLIPIIANVNTLNNKGSHQYQALSYKLITSYFRNDSLAKARSQEVIKLQALNNSLINELLTYLQKSDNFETQYTTLLSSTLFDQQLQNTIAYLLFLSLYNNNDLSYQILNNK